MRALKIDEAAMGREHPNVAIRLSNLSNVLHDLGGVEKLAEARAALLRALKIDETAGGRDYPEVATDLSTFKRPPRPGGVENFAEARAALLRALKIDETAYGRDHPKVAIDCGLIARMCAEIGGRRTWCWRGRWRRGACGSLRRGWGRITAQRHRAPYPRCRGWGSER